MEIGKKLKEKRVDANLTQKELSDILHVSRQTISSWEVGRTYPDLNVLLSISELYNVPLDDLVKEDSKLVDDITLKVKKSERRKVFNILLSFLLVVVTVLGLVYIYQDYQNNQTNAEGLSPSDIYNTSWEVHFDPTRERLESFLSFDQNSAVTFNRYQLSFVDPQVSPDEHEVVLEEWLSRGIADGVNSYQNLEVEVDGDNYVVSAQGFLMELTRLSSTIIRDSNGIEYRKVLEQDIHEDLHMMAEYYEEEYYEE
ncbi:helix-turn-helix transcriptional regulator [Alkalibacterium olivapovliticus]|uniref:DNA-binding XRE family transcriptional regulator n=1 Tax=Alkalibacterium olivapovliticus TaxID=99907 RepID=A0A2T0W5I6_9LACT|nr:helix-turn-helix transcriptional regulator [Alkalibacterium olivapovliticus]PRY81030.1 DNA-binding XRE family transcriptional regulator [Alkalibacterium olivapovliticus]